MTLLYYDPIFQEHETGKHPENGGRTRAVVQRLQKSGLDQKCLQPRWQTASSSRLGYVHVCEYLEQIEQYAKQGGGQIEADTVMGRKSYDVATMAAGAVCDAVERVVGGADKTAFCLLRPPGHHALPDHAMGFCLINNIAVGARVATEELDIERVLIVDFDVHHGNGTQAMFWEAAEVGYFSMHRSRFYPGTGNEEEVGEGAGHGTTLNLPIDFGTPRETQLTMFAEKLDTFAKQIRPQLVLVSAGFDSHKDDPVGSLGLESEDFRTLTRNLLEIATEHADGRLISVLEGGYNPTALAESVEIHLDELLRQTQTGSHSNGPPSR